MFNKVSSIGEIMYRNVFIECFFPTILKNSRKDSACHTRSLMKIKPAVGARHPGPTAPADGEPLSDGVGCGASHTQRFSRASHIHNPGLPCKRNIPSTFDLFSLWYPKLNAALHGSHTLCSN